MSVYKLTSFQCWVLGTCVSIGAVMACSGDDRLPGAPGDAGGTAGRSNTSGSANVDAGAGSEAGAASGGQAGEGNAASTAGEGGQITYEMGGAPPEYPPGVCAPMMKLGAAQDVSLPETDVTLRAMTPDELTLAYTTGAGDALALHVAERPSLQEDFVAVPATVPDGYEAASGAALSAAGTELVLVLKDHSGFGQLSRSKRGEAFGADADVAPFAKINALKPTTGHSVGWPVLSQDGKSLYFVSYFGGALVNLSTRGEDGLFDIGTEIDRFTLGGNEGQFKLLSSISTDERAIFYFDQATGHAAALFRSRPGGPFYDPLDLGALSGVAPSADCSRVYVSAAGKLSVRTAK